MDVVIIRFQGIMLLLLLLTLITRSIMLCLKDGINPFVLGKGKKGFNAILELMFLVVLLIWAYEIIAIVFRVNVHCIPIKAVYETYCKNSPLQITGALFILSGYSVFILSLISFGNSWRVGIDKSRPGRLATKGIYALTRNPIFMALELYFTGTALINMNMLFIGFAVLNALGIHYQILQEEKYLRKHYGDEYSDYKKRVRRYI